MKKIVSLVLALVLALSLVACGGNNNETPDNSANPNPGVSNTPAPSVQPEPAFGADLTAFYEKLVAAAGNEFPMMMDLAADPDMLEMILPGLKDIETKQLVAVTPMMSAVAMEFVFVEVAKAADVATVKAMLEGRIEAQVNGGAWYPETVEQWEKNSEVVVIDNYVCLFVAPGKDTLVEAFRNGGNEVPAWVEMPAQPVNLFFFYEDLYNELFPVDEEGFGTGPATMDLVEVPEMLEAAYPGLTDIAVNQLMVFVPMMSAVPYEVALIEVANAEDVDAVKAILEARIAAQTSPESMNYPMVMENWELNSQIVVNGNYIMLVATEYVDAFVEAFNAQF